MRSQWEKTLKGEAKGFFEKIHEETLLEREQQQQRVNKDEVEGLALEDGRGCSSSNKVKEDRRLLLKQMQEKKRRRMERGDA